VAGNREPFRHYPWKIPNKAKGGGKITYFIGTTTSMVVVQRPLLRVGGAGTAIITSLASFASFCGGRWQRGATVRT
jgi:hypothetical protein